MNRTLMRAIVDFASFLSLSGDDDVNPDAAVAQLEQMSSSLKTLSSKDKQAFVLFIEDLLTGARKRGDQQYIEFLAALPDDLGLR